MGQPEWHPPGQYMVFQAQKPSGQWHWGRGLAATPGFGRHSDLWLMELATRCSFRLTDMPEDDRSGVLHPHFSHDGSKLIWSEMHAAPNAVHGFGQWKIKVAGFALKEGVPVLPDVHSHVPGKAGWYENTACPGTTARGCSPRASIATRRFAPTCTTTPPTRRHWICWPTRSETNTRCTHPARTGLSG